MIWQGEPWRILISLAALIGSAAFSTMVWRVSWAIRGYVDAEKARTQINEKLMSLVQEFIDTQKSANEEQRRQNDEIWTSIQVHAFRLNDLEKSHARTD